MILVLSYGGYARTWILDILPEICIDLRLVQGFLGGASDKEPPVNGGDTRNMGLALVRSPRVTCACFFCRIAWTEETFRYRQQGHNEWDMTELLSTCKPSYFSARALSSHFYLFIYFNPEFSSCNTGQLHQLCPNLLQN